MYELRNKNYIITGASSGIGKTVAEYLTTQELANVILVARHKNIIDDLAKRLPGNNIFIEYDLLDLFNICKVFDICKSNNIRIDGFIHCAGISNLEKVEDNDIQTMINTFTVNTFSFVEFCKHLIKYDNKGKDLSVVAISSNASEKIGYRQSAYSASKSALNTYIKVIAKENINIMRVNGIIPSAVETEMLDRLREKSLNLDNKIISQQPLGIINPVNVASLIAYLLSNESKYITGSLFQINGGDIR